MDHDEYVIDISDDDAAANASGLEGANVVSTRGVDRQAATAAGAGATMQEQVTVLNVT